MKFKRPFIDYCLRLARDPIACFSVAGVAFVVMVAMALVTTTPSQELVVTNIHPSAMLSDTDRALSEAIFNADARGDYDSADDHIEQLSNQLLLGHMLAERYLNVKYNATAEELTVWLANYADHPEAARIEALAQRKGATSPVAISHVAPLKGDGYVEHLGRSTMPDSFYRGIALWKDGNYNTALNQFQKVAQNGNLNNWQRAAAHYWAYRAAAKLNNNALAASELTAAAHEPTTFYGQLAATQLGDNSRLQARAPLVPVAIRNLPAVMRATALVEANQDQMAEVELRQLVMQLPEGDRPALVTIASELGLANLQVRLASLKGLSAGEKIFASYPAPYWLTSAQTAVDPTILLSIARQESVFRNAVKSSGGAVGLMQMLPSTARHVEMRLSADEIALASNDDSLPLSKQLNDPAVSAQLGAQYVAMLAREKSVNRDLIRLIAAYNAGPGSVASWQGLARNMRDPLLYIESIPYPETRNYVMQVLAHQWVYARLMGQPNNALRTLAAGQWPQA